MATHGRTMMPNKRTPGEALTADPLANLTVSPGTNTARQPLPDVTRFNNGADSMKSGEGSHTIGSASTTAVGRTVTDALVRSSDNGKSGNTKC